MKPLKLLGILFVLTLSLSACDPIEGTLQVFKPFTAHSGEPNKPCHDYEYPCDNPVETITVEAGNHPMKVEMFGRDTIQIRLKAAGRDRVLELHVPSGKQIPSTGPFTFTAKESGQPFDLDGETQTTISRSEESYDQESCEIRYEIHVCGYRGNPPQYTCWYETRYRPGIQEVSYYFETTYQVMTAAIHQNSTTAARFQGDRSSTEKIYTHRGYCHSRGW